MSDVLMAAMARLESQIDISGEPSDWFEMTQERINTFAEATLDDQWIHVDPERAKSGPFGVPIAHGQLTMSLMSFLPGGQGIGIPVVDGLKMAVNYGWNRVRFMSPVKVGDKIRTTGKLVNVEVKGEMLEVVNQLTVEIDGQSKPACVADSVLRLIF